MYIRDVNYMYTNNFPKKNSKHFITRLEEIICINVLTLKNILDKDAALPIKIYCLLDYMVQNLFFANNNIVILLHNLNTMLNVRTEFPSKH